MPWNEKTRPLKVTRQFTVGNVNTEGRVAVSHALRRPRNAWVNNRAEGGSGAAYAVFVGFSGGNAIVEFNQADSGTANTSVMLAPVGSGAGYSGGVIELDIEGN
jgi:hypothetical protein